MDKLLTFQTQSEKGVFLYTIGEGRDHSHLIKTACAGFHPEIARYIGQATPIPGKTQVLLTALGAGEYYGSNINGDFFPCAALSHVGTDYGHKTFEHFAKVYKHHVNKDPEKSYGDVLLSVWNEEMKRVELIITIDHDKAPDIIERLDNGEYPEVSMGTKVPFDVCSCCGNKAKTRAQYCDHLRYYMNKVPPGYSKKAYAINTLPRFFDISFVFIGADRIARVMQKVAQVSSADAAHMTKVAYGLSHQKVAAKKTAEIEKIVPSNTEPNTVRDVEELAKRGREALEPLEPEIPRKVIIRMTSSGTPGPELLNRILSTLSFSGIAPKPQEFQSIALRSLGKHALEEDLHRRNICFIDCEGTPADMDSVIDIKPQHFDPYVFHSVKDMIPERSYAKPILHARIIRLTKLAQEGKLSYPKQIKTAQADERSPIGLMPMMLTLTGLYIAAGKKAPAEVTKGLDKVVASHPGIAAALGIGAVAGLSKLFGRSTKGKYDFNPDQAPAPMLSWQERIEQKNQNPLLKTSGVGSRLFLGVPAIYMASGIQQVKKARNPQDEEGAFRSFIRKNPDIASAALVGEALAGYPVSKGFKNFAKKSLGLFGKTAGISEDLGYNMLYAAALPGASLPVRAATYAIDQGIISGIEKLLERKGTKRRSSYGNN